MNLTAEPRPLLARCRRLGRGDECGIEGWKMRSGRVCAWPQQLDGISNMCSWNVRNAGQSALPMRGWKGEDGKKEEVW